MPRGRESRKRCRRIARLYKKGEYVPAICGYVGQNRGRCGNFAQKALIRTDQLFFHHPCKTVLEGLPDELKKLFRKLYVSSNSDFCLVDFDDDEGWYFDMEMELIKIDRSPKFCYYDALIWVLKEVSEIDDNSVTYEYRPLVDVAIHMLKKVTLRTRDSVDPWAMTRPQLFEIEWVLREALIPCVQNELSDYLDFIEKLRCT